MRYFFTCTDDEGEEVQRTEVSREFVNSLFARSCAARIEAVWIDEDGSIHWSWEDPEGQTLGLHAEPEKEEKTV